MHSPMQTQHERLSKTLIGHYNYYGVRGNFEALKQFHYEIWNMWYKRLKRRSQKGMAFEKYVKYLENFPLPKPKITHPEGWFLVNPGYLLGRAGCGKSARPDL